MSKKTPETEPPKRAKRAIKNLHTLVDYLRYFCNGDKFFKEVIVKELAQDIEEVLHELSIEKNIDHIRLATKLKTIWNIEQENNLEEIIEEKVEQRLDGLLDEIKRGK